MSLAAPLDAPVPLQDAGLATLPGMRHGFLGRRGGVSEGLYDSLNCGFGSGDARDRVAENRRRALLLAEAGDATLLTVHQTHSADVVVADEAWRPDAAPRADAIVTRRPGLAIAILTADCAPVLFADPEAGVIGAAHGGWRGALDGVLEATIAGMQRLGARPEATVAAVGPCIGPASYEVGPEFPKPFLARDPAHVRFFRPAARAGHFLFDLPAYVSARLADAGVRAATTAARDTCADVDRFFSYRRATHAGERDYGRQVSLITLER